MRLKYYLRGVGVGVVATAIIMSLGKDTEELSDGEIKLRAAKLGMVEKDDLTSIVREEDNTNEQAASSLAEKKYNEEMISEEETTEAAVMEETEEETIEAAVTEENEEETTEEAATEEIKEETAAGNLTEESEEEAAEEAAEEAIEESMSEDENRQVADEINGSNEEDIPLEYVVVSIRKGSGSEEISQVLLDAGLISSVKEYNKFLVDNNYSRRLSAGEHRIPVGASDKEIAEILCEIRR